MFERFTEAARRVVMRAQEEARALGHDYIGTEHLLLGLLREPDGLGARALSSLGVSIDDVRADVGRVVGRGNDLTSGQIPFTPRAKRVLELSFRAALSLGHDHIGTEHLLLGLARERDGVAMRILYDRRVRANEIRARVIEQLGMTPPPETGPQPPPSGRSSKTELAVHGSSTQALAWSRRAQLVWIVASGAWALVGLAVGLALGWAIWR